MSLINGNALIARREAEVFGNSACSSHLLSHASNIHSNMCTLAGYPVHIVLDVVFSKLYILVNFILRASPANAQYITLHCKIG
jgi:hypothetical protein